jgi:hypothetical protein
MPQSSQPAHEPGLATFHYSRTPDLQLSAVLQTSSNPIPG